MKPFYILGMKSCFQTDLKFVKISKNYSMERNIVYQMLMINRLKEVNL